MQQIHSGYRGVTLLLDLNMDRLLWLGAIALALVAGGFLGTL